MMSSPEASMPEVFFPEFHLRWLKMKEESRWQSEVWYRGAVHLTLSPVGLAKIREQAAIDDIHSGHFEWG